MNAMLLPFQTAFDPPQQAEGSLDPLGLYAVADGLGVRLAPGVRERQSTPRYLTLAVVGLIACQDLPVEPGSRLGIPAWLAYEWLVVQSLVRGLAGTERLEGVPGRAKVAAALGHGEPLCASNYLKTPSVTGFHGIYRVLGVKTGLFTAEGSLLERGRRLLAAFCGDQQLPGFAGGAGAGQDMRRALERAIEKTVKSGTQEQPGSELSAWIVRHLHPQEPGPLERESLWALLTDADPSGSGAGALRREYLCSLAHPEGQADWCAAADEEARYHPRLVPRVSQPLQQLLMTIQAYERFSRLLTDAFDEVRAWLSQDSRPVAVADLATGPCMRRVTEQGEAALGEAMLRLGEVDRGLWARLQRTFAWVAEPRTPGEFAVHLLAHHERVQRDKPPGGKRPWIDSFGDGRVALRPPYVLQVAFTPREGTYVNRYRTRPLWSFARDLGRVPAAL